MQLAFASLALRAAVVALLAGLLAGPLRADSAITPGEVTSHVRYLASEELAGRGSGTPGGKLAAEYMARHFRTYGLAPAGDGGSYFQRFPVITGVSLGDTNRIEVRANGAQNLRLRVRDDFMPVAFTPTGSAEGPAVFVGYGISQPEMKHDDYAGLDVRGKVVIVLRRAPEGGEHGRFGAYSSLRYKATVARDRGAAAILFVTGPVTSREEDLGQLESDGSFSDAGIPAAIVRRRFVERLLSGSGRDLAGLQKATDKEGPKSLELPRARVTMRVSVVRERRDTANVIGRLEGTDPKLKEEVVVIGAHYDHLGMGGRDSLSAKRRPEIHYGADDNASGTAGVIELAEYFAAHRNRLRRSVLFMGFSGEEMGLLGSAYYVRNPVVPLEKTVAMINMDMIGRSKNDTVHVLGTKTSPEWQAILDAVNGTARLNLKTGGSGFGNSDQSSFYARNIPVLFFFTGTHEDYHRPTDTWEKLNVPAQVKILRFVAATVERIADLPERPKFVRSDDATPGGTPGFSVYVGTVPDYSESENGVTLTGVREGSPAEKAGLRAGDVIVQFGGRPIKNVYDYTYALRDAKAGQPMEVVVLRGGERVKLNLTPAARR